MGHPLTLIGYASGNGASNLKCAEAPLAIQNSALNKNVFEWANMLIPKDNKQKLEALNTITEICTSLADTTHSLIKKNKFFVTLGGDHSCAIGTWSGVASAIAPKELGLLWIDAHLDSHTFETTPSGNIHGMPLAALLGYGEEALTQISSPSHKLNPENVCVFGVRSFEAGEQKLLESLNVRIYYMEEINERGFSVTFNEAIEVVSRHTKKYGISLDLDGIDPTQAPGVGSPEPHGLDLHALYEGFNKIARDPQLIAAEIVEFNPSLDKDHKTEKIILHLLDLFSKRFN